MTRRSWIAGACLVMALAGCSPVSGFGSAQAPSTGGTGGTGQAGAASPAAHGTSAAAGMSASRAAASAARLKAMSEADFWKLVDTSLDGTRGDANLQAVQLRNLLEQHSADQLIAFQYRLASAADRLYTWRYEAAGDLLCGSLGVDGFTEFRTWVVSRGQAAYQAALANPDTLAPLADELQCPGAELFGAAPTDAYQDKTGVDLSDVDDVPELDQTQPPPGDGPIDPEKAAKMFPRLAVIGRSLQR